MSQFFNVRADVVAEYSNCCWTFCFNLYVSNDTRVTLGLLVDCKIHRHSWKYITLNINKKKFFALPMRVIFVIFCCCLMSLFYVSQWWEIAQMTRDIDSREQQWTKRRVILARGMGGWNFSVEILRLTYYFIDGKEKLSFRRHSFSSLRWTLEIMQHHCVPNIFFLVVISSSHHYVNDRMKEKLRGKFYAMQFNQFDDFSSSVSLNYHRLAESN